MEIEIKVITFPPAWGENPLPYVPAFCEWNDHVKVCVPCARVDQLATSGQPFDPFEMCDGGAQLQTTLARRIMQQHQISMWN